MNKELSREHQGKITSIIGIFANIFLAISKIVVGAVFGIISVLADGLNNLSDCGSGIVSLISFKISSKPADKEHPYGHERIEYVSSMAVSFLILLIAFELIKESISKIIEPQNLDFSIPVILVLVISIMVKAGLFFYYRAISKKINSDILWASAIDSISDCVSTFAVLFAGLIGKLTNINIDGYAGILVAVFIAITGIKILKETTSKLIGQAPAPEFLEDIKGRILFHKDVLGIHDLNVYSYGPNKYFASVHIELDANLDILKAHDIIDKIEKEFVNDTNIILTAHLDPKIIDNEEINNAREMVNSVIKNIDKKFFMHDFRLIKNEKNANLIFEVAIPFDSKLSFDFIESRIREEILKINSNYVPIITIEKQIL